MRTLLLLTLFAMLLGGGIWLWSGNTVEPAPAATSGDEARGDDATVTAASGAKVTATTDASSTPRPTREAASEAPPEDRQVRGTVQRLGAPHGGAYVRVHDRAPAEDPDATLLAEAQTDANGEFSIEWDPTWPPRVAVTASAEQCVDAAQADVDGAHELRLRLGVAISIRGAVTAREDGRSLAGASVRHREATVQAGADGRYTMTIVMTNRDEHLYARLKGFEDGMARIRLHEGAELTVDFTLSRQGHLDVVAFDLDSGAPIAGAYATLRRELAGDVERSTASGALRIRYRDGDDLYTYLMADGYCATRWSWSEPTASPQPIRVPLRRAAQVVGSVRDEHGEPVAASVYIASVEHRHDGVLLTADHPLAGTIPGEIRFESSKDYVTCGEDGTFALTGVPGEQGLQLTASAKAHVTAKSAPFSLIDDRPVTIELTLRTAHQLRGLARENDGDWHGRIAWRPLGAEGWSGRARTDAQGRFTLDGLPTGSIELVAMSMFGRDELQRKVVQTPLVDDAEVVIAWQRSVATISGRVTCGGVPAAGFTVRAWPSDRAAPGDWAETAADGTYELEVAADDTYRVTVTRAQVTADRADVAAGSRGVDFALPPLAKVRVRLVDAATGAPCTVGDGSWAVGWRPSGEANYRIVPPRSIDTTGLLVLEVASGVVDVATHLADQGYAPAERVGLAAIAGQEPAEHRIELRRGHELRLRLDESTPMELEQGRAHMFFLLRDDEADQVRGPFEAAGPPSNHRINGHHMWLARPSLLNQVVSFHPNARPRKGLAPGTYTLRAFPDDVVFEPATINVPGDDEVVLRWREK